MTDMAAFWDERAREDAFFFVDNELAYRSPDLDRFWGGGEEVVERVLEQLEAQLLPGQRVVDLGCGLGRLTRALAARGASVTALDVSAEMLNRARALSPQLHHVDWIHGDGTTLRPIADASVDVVFSFVVFQHIPDPRITLGYIAEIGRVLRPGGWAAFQVSTDPAVHKRSQPLTARIRAGMGRAPKGQADPRWLGSAVALDELGATATAAGLTLDRVVAPGSQYTLVRASRDA